MLLVFFVVLFAAILIHPEWDLPAVHDVKITSARHQAHNPAERPIQPLAIGVSSPLADFSPSFEWLPQARLVEPPASSRPLLTVLRV